ncbi:hypothetical protein RUND412_007865 [Rhizina undulata]
MPPQTPPWKPLLAHHLTLIKPATFTLATISSSTSPINPSFTTSSDAPAHISPRCRTMIYRGFLGNLPENPHNPLATHNPQIFTTDLLTFTTDSRSTKIGEFLPPEFKSGGDASMKSFGGGPVEACFWIAGDTTTGEKIQNQWRIRGKCYLLAEEDVDSASEITSILQKRMLLKDPADEEKKKDWSWKKEVQAHFGNLAPAMRGSFANPPPGAPLDVPLESLPDEKTGAVEGVRLVKGRKVPNEDVLREDGVAAVARRSFRVGVIVPEVVERVDLLEDDGRARRWVWWWTGDLAGKGKDAVAGWKGTETWP